MRKAICLLLVFLLIVSGCSEHLSDHCIEMSEEIALPTGLREDYHPVLTPITDTAGECYCHIEDVALIVLIVGIIIGVGYAQSMASTARY
ncbi:hypothetical protein ACFL3Q_09520 [Planctomycetota bacterium]